MAISSDGTIHMIRCDTCPTQDGHASVSVRDFIDAMKRLGWQFFECDDGSFDSICPDCLKRRGGGAVPEIKIHVA